MINRQDVEETLPLILERLAFNCYKHTCEENSHSHTHRYSHIETRDTVSQIFADARNEEALSRVLFACLRKEC